MAPEHAPLGLNDVEIRTDETLYRGFFELRLLTLRHRLFAGGWSATLRRELLHPRRAVGVLLFDPVLDAVVLVEQFRVGVVPASEQSPWLLELVAGVIEPGEAVEQVAHREAEEEAHCRVEQLETVANYYSSPGISSEYFYLFCGKADLSAVGGYAGVAAEHEDIRVHVVPFANAWHWVETGVICNAHTLVAMQWLKIHRERLLAQWR